ncbi:MAG: histidine kinase [Nitrospinaceae bacterium]|nr:MAG: histidine kinase [Nitrospinaceae bacterium]
MVAKQVSLQVILVFLIYLGFGCFLIYLLESKREFESRTVATLMATSHAKSLEKQLSRSLSSTFALAAILKRDKSIKDFDALAEDLIDRYGGISTLELAPKGIVGKIFPLEGHQKAIGHDLNKNPYALAAIQSKQLTLEGPKDLIEGGVAVVGRYPVFLQNSKLGKEEFWGFTTVLIKLSKLLEGVDGDGLISKNYHFELSRVDGGTNRNIAFAKSSSNISANPVSVDILIPNGKWILSVVPKTGWHSAYYLIIEGILVLIFCGALSLLSYRNFRKNETLATTNIKLTQEIHQREKVEMELLRSNQALNEFASIAAHDLQEPLRKIITFGDRLKTKINERDKQGNDYLERMQNSALRLRALVEDLLQFTKIEAKARPFDSIDLKKVIENVLDDLETRIKESKGVVNISSLPTIQGDPVQIHQLFLNLVGNAFKFYRDGIPPVVNLDSAKSEKGGWEIFVTDNGIGIDEKHVDRIFKPFERLHGRSTYEGTGIGLSICKKIVTRHGGQIAVKRQSTNGITFQITLPETQNKERN